MFQENFLWGASLSGFQFEMSGDQTIDPNSDWYVWLKNRENRENGLIVGDDPDFSAGYWNGYPDMHQLAQNGGMNALRIGVEWSRIFPNPTFGISGPQLDDIVDHTALERYKMILQDLKTRKMTTMVCLNHFTLPLWLHDPIAVNRGERSTQTGWVDERIAEEFSKYATVVVRALDPWVDYWSTLNEPHVVALLGYNLHSSGFPPAIVHHDFLKQALENESRSHIKAYHSMKEHTSKPVGIIYASGWATGPKKAREAALFDGTWRFLDSLQGTMDFLGINYYSRMKVAERGDQWEALPGFGQGGPINEVTADGRPTSDFGWEIFPEGLAMILKAAHNRYRLPLFVMENGIADNGDRYRPYFLVSHLYAVERALRMGADVRGYFHWSLTDNYEWAKGRTMRFGLARLDFDTGVITPRPSYYLFREIVKAQTTKPWETYLRHPFLLWEEEYLHD